MKPVLKILRYRDRILKAGCKITQPAGYDPPVEVRTDKKPDSDPGSLVAEQAGGTRQAHKQPRTHVRCLCTQRGYPGIDLSFSQEIGGQSVLRTIVEINTN